MNDSKQFDWFDDDADVVVREQQAIAVYLNPHGDLVIRQQHWPDDDTIIVVAIDRVEPLVEAICERAGLASSPPQKKSSSSDRTAAARQKRYRERHRNGERNGERNVTDNVTPDAKRNGLNGVERHLL